MSKEIINNEAGGCGCSAKSENEKTEQNASAETEVKVEFLYLDLNVCEPCKTSDENIVAALDEVAVVARAAGIKLSLERIHIRSLEQAIRLGFQTSPTIRINGRDLQLDFKESNCDTCSELSGTETNCRIWEFQGRTFKYLPKAMLVGAIFREIYGGAAKNKEPEKIVATDASLKNLSAFFEAKDRKESAGQYIR